MKAKAQTRTHIVIPDTQQKPGVPNIHLGWIGQYIVDEYAGTDLAVVHLGDHWDMPSLSSYDKGKKAMENRRIDADLEAGMVAFDLLAEPIYKVRGWEPELWFLPGNHEDRTTRYVEDDAQLEGLLGLKQITDYVQEWGWGTTGYLEPLCLDGITYAHYFYNPMSGRPYAGANIELRLKQVGHSFTMGHQQGFRYGEYPTIRGTHHGLVAGSCYIHDEDYLGPQTTNYWRGIVVCHQVENGTYDLMKVSLDYLARRYEGKRLSAVRWRH